MELFMRHIGWDVTKLQLEDHVQALIRTHTAQFAGLTSRPVKCHVRLHPDRRRKIHKHAGTGILTLPSADIANRFLALFGSADCPYPILIGKKTIAFEVGKNSQGLPSVIEQLNRPSKQQPVAEPYEQRTQSGPKDRIAINAIQFGWECRDYVFSIESEEVCPRRAVLTFTNQRREIRIELQKDGDIYFVAINYSHILEIYVNNYLDREASIVFSLHTAPMYERARQPLRERLSYLPIPNHQRVAPYASIAIRLVCESVNDLQEFRRQCMGNIHKLSSEEYPIAYRDLFSEALMTKFQTYLRKFNWCVSFQLEAIIRDLRVDMKEMVEMMPTAIRTYRLRGKEFTGAVLRKFAIEIRRLFAEDDYENATDPVQCLLNCEKEVSKNFSLETLKPTDGSLCDAYHVIITPTSMRLEGPVPERSNRVIRAYDPEHQESFLRVSFVDENRSKFRFDREVDGPAFIRSRVGPFLLQGLVLGYRKFEFLAYSQSALKEHAVWFVKPFQCKTRGLVNAKSIIASLGSFNVTFDPKLIYCPARYAARISQAFTATDSVQIEVEEILPIDDISTPDGKYQFTDGVGTMSSELAQQMWKELKKTKRKGRVHKGAPSAYQVRFMGSKGMLSVDYKLKGLAICLRPSMIKFDAAAWTNIEVARAFDKPGVYYLNRPLIMLLEGLGVPYGVFQHFQDIAVSETRKAAESLGQAAPLFERFGLGASFRLPSVMNHLHSIGIRTLPNDEFYKKVVEYGVNHVLRDLKNHARIPIPDAWTLVGVADVHKYLKPREVFACIKPLSGKTIYLKGPVLISRSPTIHPGDVTIVQGIGRPPPGSCFAAEPLANTIVFSVLGDRPIPSCLGGGDLDGDVYNVIPLKHLPQFEPQYIHEPASYEAAPKRLLDRPSTMADVAEFVMEYINSDVVGIIATNWLLTADSSPHGILDKDCITLANLHSNAVDYPKSGQPVALKSIPKLQSRQKPDWNAPETVTTNSKDYYPSQRAIGRLFRAIDLPIEHMRIHPHAPQARSRGTRVGDDLASGISNFDISRARTDNDAFAILENHVQVYIRTDVEWFQTEVDFVAQLYSRFTSELRGHCASNTLSYARDAQLSEEEAVVGTIIQKTSNRTLRKNAMTKLREGTDHLCRGIREELEGDDSIPFIQYLERAWMAWELSISRRTSNNPFGAAAFGWIALGAIFDAIGKLEEDK